MMWTLLLLGQGAPSAPAPSPQMRLAVLPLEQGAGSQEYLGLGVGLSGMLVSDLAGVQGLSLVERAQLDSVLAELELAEGSFLDPKTAALIGKGVGAETLLLGSYSVVEQTFILDARIVQVSSGEVILARAAQGEISDFVSVEKELVVGLVEGLELELSAGNRRALYSSAPTESFGAFSAYGAGLAQEAAGDLEAAQKAYQQALKADPDYAQAQQALAALKQALAAYTQARDLKYDTAYRQMNQRVLTATQTLDPKAIALDALPAFVLRLAALENEGQDCQRAKEMAAYLSSQDYAVAVDLRDNRTRDALEVKLENLQGEWSFESYSDDTGGPPIAQEDTERALPLFGSSEAFLFGYDSWPDFHGAAFRDPNSGYLASVSRCMSAPDALAEVDRLHKEMGARKLLAPTDEDPGVGDQLEGIWLLWSAQFQGATEPLATRSQRLLNRVRLTDPSTATEYQKELESWAIDLFEEVVDEAERRDLATRTLYGQSDAEGLAFMKAFGAKDSKVVTLKGPLCAPFAQEARSAQGHWDDYQEEASEEDHTWMLIELTRGNRVYAPMKDLGCVVGHPAKYSDVQQIIDLLRVVMDRNGARRDLSEDCQRGLEGLPLTLSPLDYGREHWTPKIEGQFAADWLETYHGLRADGCLAK